MCVMGSTLGLWEPAVLVLHFIASTALLSFLSSVSKCQSRDSDLILPVDVCVCASLLSPAASVNPRAYFRGLETPASIYGHFLHACMHARLCECVVAEHRYVMSNRTECLYSVIIKFCDLCHPPNDLSSLSWNDKKHNPIFVFSFHTVCNRSYRQYFIYFELYLHPVCAHRPQPASLHFTTVAIQTLLFAFTQTLITSTHNPFSPHIILSLHYQLSSASETCWWSILLFLLTSGLFSYQLRRAMIITEKYKSSL